jgi:hypothetical protein
MAKSKMHMISTPPVHLFTRIPVHFFCNLLKQQRQIN